MQLHVAIVKGTVLPDLSHNVFWRINVLIRGASGLPSFYTVSKTSVKTGTPATISAKRSMRGRSMYSVMFGIS